ncbi:trypsin-like serine protease [Actinoplanes sp. NPDC051851]|uniref:S1 family peptidase n=1 Tax=Actinoplanes sp. NPDC051851 TaxID=3154753 RepID=UPI00341AA550
MKLLKRAASFAVALTVAATGLFGLSASPAAAIIGGQDASRTHGSVFVKIDFGDEGVAQCSATLVVPPGTPIAHDGIGASNWVKTADHCITWDTVAPASLPVDPQGITVYANSVDRTAGQTATGLKVFVHPAWAWGVPETPDTPIADEGLVKIDRVLRGPVTEVASLPAPVGSTVVESGWGLTTWPVPAGTTLPTVLQQKTVTRLPDADCAGGGIGVGEVCLSKGACFGDSGGPAFHVVNGLWRQVALASRETVDGDVDGDGDDDTCGSPTVYTDSVYFADWEKQTMRSERHQPCVVKTKKTLTTSDKAQINRLKNARTWLPPNR